MKLKAPNIVPTKYNNIKIPLKGKKTEFFSEKKTQFFRPTPTLLRYTMYETSNLKFKAPNLK